MAKKQAQPQLNLGPIFNPPSGTKKTKHGAVTWNQLTGQAQKDFWARVNDIFLKILGRSATMGEAQKAYQSGYGSYALAQRLYMSKEFTHSQLFHQMARQYNYYLQQFVGNGFHLTAKQIQSFAAHGYSSTDIQAWVYHQPKLYMQTHDYKNRVDQMLQVYRDTFGIDPTQQQERIVDTNKRMPGDQPGIQYNTPLLQHIQAAALHFSTPDEYRQYLESSGAYKNILTNRIAPSTGQMDAGLSINTSGRPVQNGLSPLASGNRPADVGA